MTHILSLETSTHVCSAAVHADGKLVASEEIHIGQSHASKLAVAVHHVIAVAGIATGSLSAVAVSSGPGSFTGLRIGVATAKGLCLGMGIPLIALRTLEVMALALRRNFIEGCLLCPMIDARRHEVYCMIYDSDLHVVQEERAISLDKNSFRDWLETSPVIFFGNGAGKCMRIIEHGNARYVDEVNPLASVMGVRAFSLFRDGVFESLEEFEPFYLKEFHKGLSKVR